MGKLFTWLMIAEFWTIEDQVRADEWAWGFVTDRIHQALFEESSSLSERKSGSPLR